LIGEIFVIIYGVITALAPPHLAAIMAAAFIAYVALEEWHKGNEAYNRLIDYMGTIAIVQIIRMLIH